MYTRLLRIATALAMLSPSLSFAQETVNPLTLGDPVLHWNAIALHADMIDHSGTYGASDQNGPGKASRALAMVHAAMFDAVNSLDGSHDAYRTNVPITGHIPVSMEAAVTEAAHEVLKELYPKQKQYLSSQYKIYMAEIPFGSAKTLGSGIGKAAATKILFERRRDGSEKELPYTVGTEPGQHQLDPLNPNQGVWGPGWGQVKPFALQNGSQFRAPPPPALSSAEYAASFHEAKEYGSDGISYEHHRDQNQTEMGLFWAYDGTKGMGTPPRLYNQITRQIAADRGNSVVDNARLFALVNIAMADAGISSWESKFYYNYWRPVVAIRDAENDGNPETDADTVWTPLGAPASNSTNPNFTPPFPAYPSGHATFGAAAFRMIEKFYGTNNISFTFMSDEMNGVTTDNTGAIRPASPRTYANLDEAIYENGKSRIYLGIHWDFDATAGIAMGKSIADYVYDSILQSSGN